MRRARTIARDCGAAVPALPKETYVPHIMLRPPIVPTKLRLVYGRARSLGVLAETGARVINIAKARRVEHRDGAGHLDAAYEAGLRARVRDRARGTRERAFVSGPSSMNATAEESGEEFVMSVTSGVDGGESALDEETSEERGGPFVVTSATVEFAHGTDESNPRGATREPFPTS